MFAIVRVLGEPWASQGYPQGYSPIVQPDKLVGNVYSPRLQDSSTNKVGWAPSQGFRV